MQVYKITNKINGKIYIGQDSRDNPKYFGSGFLIRRAIQKYGRESFVKEVLSVCSSREVLNWMERFWISVFDSTNLDIGYNMTSGGTGGDTITNHPNRAEICRRIRERVIENFKNPEIGKKISKALTGRHPWNVGKPPSFETRRKIGDSNIGKRLGMTHTKETKKKISDSSMGNKRWFGKHHTTESREKMIQSAKNRSPVSEETKKKMSNSQQGRTHSEETKMKISMGNKGKRLGIKSSDKTKKKISDGLSGENNPMFGKHHSEETKRKIRESQLGENGWFYGKRHSEETKQKMRHPHKKRIGE